MQDKYRKALHVEITRVKNNTNVKQSLAFVLDTTETSLFWSSALSYDMSSSGITKWKKLDLVVHIRLVKRNPECMRGSAGSQDISAEWLLPS
jgi:hypothetical protein